MSGIGERDKRERKMTDKGMEYTRDIYEQKLTRSTRNINRKCEHIEHLIFIEAELYTLRTEHSEWMILFENYLQLFETYSSVLLPESENKFEQELTKLKTFKGKLDHLFSSQPSYKPYKPQDNPIVRPIDSISNVRSGSSHSRRSGSSLRSSIISARLKEDQHMTELKAKSEAMVLKKQLELERLNLTLKEEELTLQTEMAIATARSKVLDKYDTGNENLNPVKNNNQQTFKPDGLNPETKPFVPHQAFQPVNNESDVIHSVVRQLRKPPPEIQKFSGDPLHYRKFIRQFEVQVVANSETTDELMLHLEQLTCGEANKIVSSLSHLDSKQGYYDAKAEFEERYGDPEIIANAFIKRAIHWPTIKPGNPKALDDYAIFLSECEHAINSIHAMKILDYSENLKLILGKLPFYFHDRWRNIVQQIKRSGQIIEFTHLVKFIKEEAKKANDPVYGRIAMRTESTTIQKSQKTSKPQYNIKGSYFIKDDNINDHQKQITEKDIQSTKRTAFTPPCMFCHSVRHSLESCHVISKTPLEETTAFLMSNRLCFGCLRYNHLKKDCRRRAACGLCKKQHPTICHRDGFVFKEQLGQRQSSPLDSSINVNSSMGAGNLSENECTMAIVPVIVKLKGGIKTIQTHAFLDPGSSVTFVSDDIIRQLGGQGAQFKVTLNTMGQPYSMDTRVIKGLQIGSLQDSELVDLPKTYTKDKLPVTTGLMPTQDDISQWPHLRDISIPHVNSGVGLLIGNNVPDVYSPIDVRTGPTGSPHAIKSRIGWIFWNVIRPRKHDNHSKPIYTVNKVEISAIQQIEELKKLDILVRHSINLDFPEKTSTDKKEHSQNDKLFLQKVDTSIKLKNGHYHIDLPFKDEEIQLPNNRIQAVQRVGSLKRKLNKDEKLQRDYTALMTELVERGHSEKVPDNEIQREDGYVWYLPHHNVIHPHKPDKVRIVFDCAASYRGVSLNDQLLQGPDLTNYLIGVLIRFRTGKVAIMADIEAMFHQVFVTKKYTDCLRYLWWNNGDLNQSPSTYRMLVHLFGATSSPSCANAALKQTAHDNKEHFDKSITDIVHQNFYVDDCLVSVDDNTEALKVIKEVTKLCSLGGFHLTKWTSSSPTVLQSIPATERAKTVKTVNLDRQDLPVERALGVHWFMDRDNLGFKITPRDYTATRRGLLSAISTVYDPLGIASPFVLIAKILLQELCARQLEWDTPLTDKEQRRWNQWLSDLPLLEKLQLQRCYKPNDFGHIQTYQLHCFSDASDKGYGVTCYLRLIDNTNKICCSLVLAKSRVAPLKKVTIPRMELTAATLSIRLSQMILREISYTVDSVFYWTDSMAVINYIANSTTRFQTFVANRLTVIHDSSSADQWHYINSKVNPADAASRGQPIKELIQDNSWLYGPKFLYLPESEWTQQKPISTENQMDNQQVMTNSCVKPEQNIVDSLLCRFSSWSKLKRITARILTLKGNWKIWTLKRKEIEQRISLTVSDQTERQYLVNKEMKEYKEDKTRKKSYLPQTLSADQLQKAEFAILRYTQTHYFSDEMKALEMCSNSSGVRKTSPLYRLDPFLQDGLLRAGGRLSRADIPYESRHPILLPKKSPVSNLILTGIHVLIGHLGRNSILAKAREDFWILGAGSLVKQIVSKCVHCRKYQSPKVTQKMADLPAERLEANTPPFTHVGMDYFGPFDTKIGRNSVKRYGVIFTCLVTRAVHLEVAHRLDADSCLQAIRRFIARRGIPKTIRSDNGTNLVASEKILREQIKLLNQSNLPGALAKQNIHWDFNPPTASHFGGIWERLIRSVRKVMNGILREQNIKLNDEGLNTLMCEVESILNSRPITELPTQPNDLEALTPNHLLMLKKGEGMPPGLFSKDDNFAKRRWRQIQFLSDLFWRRWLKLYIPLLQERSKWQTPRRNVSEGDIVLVVDDMPRKAWCLGRVLQTVKDKRGLVRSVQLKTGHGLLSRPVHKLCTILEADY